MGGVFLEKKELRGDVNYLAKLLGVSVRRVNQMVTNEGKITKEPEGDFILQKAISQYYMAKYKLSQDNVDYNHEKALHERAKRKLTEMEVRKRSNELHEAADVEAVLTDMLVNLRTKLLGIPAKMATQLAERSKEEVESLLTKEIEFILLEVKDYKPTMFEMSGKSEE
jgi:plasmid maintenance system antidote protein VapI